MNNKKRPIQYKITRAILMTSTLVLLLTGMAYFAYEFLTFRETTVDRMIVLGEVISNNSTAALAFDSKDEAYEVLSALRAQDHIVSAALYDENDSLFSSFPRNADTTLVPAKVGEYGYFFEGLYLHGFTPVILGNKRIGSLYLKYDLQVLGKQFFIFGFIVIAIFILSLLLAWVLSSKLQRRISRPIMALAEVARSVSINKDYSVRAVKQSDDETGLLTDAFNQMLTQIQEQSHALKESENRFRTIADNIAQLAWMTDESGSTTWYNKRWFDYTGTTFEEMQGWGWRKVHHPDHVERVVKKFSNALKMGEIWEDTFPIRNKEGNYGWFLSRAIPIRNESGKILHWFGTNTDITELRNTEEALRLSEEFSRTLLESSPDCVKALDLEGKLLSINQQGLRMLEIESFDAYYGMKMTSLWSEEYHSTVEAAMEKALNGGIGHFQGVTATARGAMKWWDVLMAPVYGPDDQVERLISVSRDITKLKELEQQKDDFIGIASHELKTPVTSIKAYTQVLQDRFRKSDDQKSLEMLEKMDAQINKLTNLITDLLDVTKIEQGKLQFREEPFDFNELVNDVAEEVQRTAKKHHVILELDKTRDMVGDRDRVGQVITNLLTNAIKYSPRADKVVVRTEVRHDALIFSVQDFGLGLSEEDRPRVFERFYRVGDPGHETYPGLGLGLFISASIVHRQNGRIWVESEKGRGSTFYFSLPLQNKLKDINEKQLAE